MNRQTLHNIGYGNLVVASRIVAVVSPLRIFPSVTSEPAMEN